LQVAIVPQARQLPMVEAGIGALITFGNPELIARLSGDEANETQWVDKAIEHMLVPIFASA
jgi:hypothetical protein